MTQDPEQNSGGDTPAETQTDRNPPTPSPTPPPHDNPDPSTLLAPNSAPEEHKVGFLKRIGYDIEDGVMDVVHIVRNLPKLIKAWNALAPQVKSVMAQITHDVMKVVMDVEGEIADVEALDFGRAFTLAPETIADLKTLILDARAGEEGIAASLKVLGITLQ